MPTDVRFEDIVADAMKLLMRGRVRLAQLSPG